MSHRRRLAYSFILTTLVAAMAPRIEAAAPNQFEVFSLPNPAGPTPLLPGRLYVPPEAQNGPRPMIVFLHGAGEAGTNNTLQVNGNIDNLLFVAKNRGAFLYAPQASSGNGGWNGQTVTDRVMSMVDKAIADYPINSERIYITGLSMGGGGTWSMISRYGERFAAAVPICGIVPASDYSPPSLLDEPIWAYHARNDGTVSVGNTRSRVNSLLTLTGETIPTYPTTALRQDFQVDSSAIDLHYTEYWTGDHGIWPKVYNGASNKVMYDWMFAHGVPEPGTAVLVVIGGVAIHNRRRNR